jgi:hypothetical protein
MSEVAIILLAAAAALSAVELIGGPLRGRALINKYAVRRWLLKGLRRWPVPRTASRVRYWALKTFRPGLALMMAWRQVNGELRKIVGGELPAESSIVGYKFDWDLVALATGGDPGAFYRLEADQLAAQVSAAAEVALSRPQSNATLIVALARIKRDEVEPTTPISRTPDGLGDYLRQEHINFETIPKDSKVGFVAVRRDLTSRIQRRLDELQIKTRSAQEIGDHFGFLIIATAIVADLTGWKIQPVPWYVLGPVAGFISPLIRRIIRALGR